MASPEFLRCIPFAFQADLALSNSVTVGAYAAVKECANQFKYDRWNCPASAFLVRPAAPSGGKKGERESEEDNETMTREASLVRAFTSAGITFTLTKNCSAGDFANCLCDSSKLPRLYYYCILLEYSFLCQSFLSKCNILLVLLVEFQ